MPEPGTTYRPAGGPEELLQILSLQEANPREGLAPGERRSEGFVTLRHSMPLLKRMQEACPQLVAVQGKEVIGYALCLHPALQQEVPALAPMFERIRQLLGASRDYRVMGQICIAKKARRQGHFRALYARLQQQCQPLPIITEVAAENLRSLEAHHAIGFRLLDTHREENTTWHVIIQP